ncbi:hypothetical protein DAI22_01g393900 [Oryza sativa Japonica Group]|nr:hypothetical protein DAI22_01g393900 [Oryza sativa Japonica Group]
MRWWGSRPLDSLYGWILTRPGVGIRDVAAPWVGLGGKLEFGKRNASGKPVFWPKGGGDSSWNFSGDFGGPRTAHDEHWAIGGGRPTAAGKMVDPPAAGRRPSLAARFSAGLLAGRYDPSLLSPYPLYISTARATPIAGSPSAKIWFRSTGGLT